MGKSSSKSQADQTTITNNTDKRLVNDSGIALSSEGSNINISNQSIDADIVKAALDFAAIADVSAGEGFSQTLSLADRNFSGLLKSQENGYSGLLGATENGFAGILDSQENGFGKLLDFAGKIFEAGNDQVAGGQQAVLQTLQSVENDKRGAIDQKTIIVLGVSAAAIAAMVLMKKAA